MTALGAALAGFDAARVADAPFTITQGGFRPSQYSSPTHTYFEKEPAMTNETSPETTNYVTLQVTQKPGGPFTSETVVEFSVSDATPKNVKAMIELATTTIKRVLK